MMFLLCLTHVTQQYSDTVTANISNADKLSHIVCYSLHLTCQISQGEISFSGPNSEVYNFSLVPDFETKILFRSLV